MNTSIRDRLLHVEEKLLLAVDEGKDALSAFDDMWSSLYMDLDQAARDNVIDDETFSLGDSVALRVGALSEYLSEFQKNTNAILSLQSDLESVFARVEISDTLQLNPASSLTSLPFQDHSILRQRSPEMGHPAYIGPAYSWLLHNLHNPYPSKTFRHTLSAQTGASCTAIDTWFIDVRKRIGWNALRRKSFSNKRIEIVDSASRFFLGTDPNRPLDSDIAISFATIEANAQNLYSEKFVESALITKLEEGGNDSTLRSEKHVQAHERGRKQQSLYTEQARQHSRAAASYPSPHPSPSSTPERTFALDEPDLSNVLLTPIAGCKRSSLSPDSDRTVFESSDGRRNKRSRLSNYSEISSTGNLPSPAPSLELLPVDLCNSTTSSNISTPPVSRKRRLSEGHCSMPKRPRNILSGPRLNVVSDPLPLSPWFEEHFGAHFTEPVDESELSLPFDIELYDYSNLLREIPASLNAVNTQNDSRHLPRESTSPPADARSLTPEPGSFPFSVTTNHFDYNDLLHSPEGFGYDASVQAILTECHPSSLTFHLSQSSNDIPTMVPDPTTTTDHSTFMPDNPLSNFDWILPPFSPSQLIQTSHFSQGPSLAVEPSELGAHAEVFPCGSVTAAQISSESEKTLKQKKLVEMREAVRRLEAEIIHLSNGQHLP